MIFSPVLVDKKKITNADEYIANTDDILANADENIASYYK